MTRFEFDLNGRFLLNKLPTGVQNWSRNLLEEMYLDERITINVITPPPYLGRGVRGHLWEQLILPFRRNRKRKLINLANFAPIFAKNQYLVIHDVLPLTNPTQFSLLYRFAVNFFYRQIIRNQIQIATVSSFSKKQIQAYFSSFEKKICVLGAAPNRELLNANIQDGMNDLEDSDNPFPSFIAFGSNNLRKNVDFLIDIWSEFELHNHVQLHIVNRTQSGSLALSKPRNADGVIQYVDISDRELASLIRKSKALLWPSTSEGFGLPLIEFMSFGKPFLSANTGVATDLAVGLSEILELNRVTWKSKILNLMAYDETTEAMIQKEAASKYSWAAVLNIFLNDVEK